MRRFLSNNEGATIIEYGIIIFVISLMMMLGLSAFSDKNVHNYNTINGKLS